MTSRWKDKKVAVVMGGVSHEREVSLRTGAGIAKALQSQGYAVEAVTIGDDFIPMVQAAKPDVVFLALHGKYGEDGTVQGALELMHIPYTGSGVCASAVAMNKVLTKRIARTLGIHCADERVFQRDTMKIDNFVADFALPYPVIVKPNREGSTIGMSIVRNKDELATAVTTAAQLDATVLIEEFIAGTEVTVGIICGEPLTVLEIAPKGGFYDYQSKYTKGMTDYICPARVPAAVQSQVRNWTQQLYAQLDCRGVARADFMISAADKPHFLEINTIPGMTETSLVPKAADYDGISYTQICEMVLNDARCELSI